MSTEMTRSCEKSKVMLSGENTQDLIERVTLAERIYRSTVKGYAQFAPQNSKWTKHTIAKHIRLGGNGPLLVGTPEKVADHLETWIREADVDGFNFVRGSALFSKSYANRITRDMCCFPSRLRILLSFSSLSFVAGVFSGMIMPYLRVLTGRTSTAR